MKSLVILLLWLSIRQGSYPIVAIRTAFAEAAEDKSGLIKLQKLLSASPRTPLLNCYRGAAEMLSARYTINPFNKLNSFAKGKQLIENAIAADTENTECRFLRYGIQRNLPVILGYRNHLKTDSLAIIKKVDTLKDIDLRLRILNFMKRK